MIFVLNLYHVLASIYQPKGAPQNSLKLLNGTNDVLFCATVNGTNKVPLVGNTTIMIKKKKLFQVSLEDMISADIGYVLFKRESKGYARVNNKIGCPSH
jgi:hypothetical protein